MATRYHTCIVLTMLVREGRLGKRERHDAHDWWYTSWGGGHQMADNWEPSGQVSPDGCTAFDEIEGWVAKWRCPGRD